MSRASPGQGFINMGQVSFRDIAQKFEGQMNVLDRNPAHGQTTQYSIQMLADLAEAVPE